MDVEILREQNENGGQFLIRNEEGEKVGSLHYTLFGSGRLIIQHTEVSREMKGTGASGKLVEAAAEYARSSGIKIIPICPFAKSYMHKRREAFDDILAG